MKRSSWINDNKVNCNDFLSSNIDDGVGVVVDAAATGVVVVDDDTDACEDVVVEDCVTVAFELVVAVVVVELWCSWW